MFGKYKVHLLANCRDPMEYLALNIDLFRLLGFWTKIDDNDSKPSWKSYFGWPTFIVCLYLVFLVSQLIDVFTMWGDIRLVTENLCVAITIVNMLLKIGHFCLNKTAIKQLITGLNFEVDKLEEECHQKREVALQESVKKSQNVTLAGLLLVEVTFLIWVIMGYGLTSSGGEKHLPLRAWYPFKVTISPFYEIACLHQVITLFFMPYTYMLFTMLYVVLVIHICGNLKCLQAFLLTNRERPAFKLNEVSTKLSVEKPSSCDSRANMNEKLNLSSRNKFKKIKHQLQRGPHSSQNVMQTISLGVETSINATPEALVAPVKSHSLHCSRHIYKANRWNQETTNATLKLNRLGNALSQSAQNEQKRFEINREAYCRLIEVVKLHQTVLKHIKQLDTVYRPILTTQIILSLLMIGQIGYQASSFSNETEGLMKFASYLGCALTELLLYCWFSEELIHEARSVADAAYSCQWFASERKFKQTLQIIIIRAHRTELNPGMSLLSMSCRTCTSILNNSYSLFALLKQLGDNM